MCYVFCLCILVITNGGNAEGQFCVFPYIYNGVSYTSCTTLNNNDVLWCATTYNFDIHGQWGNCLRKHHFSLIKDAICSVPETISVIPWF